MRICQVHPACGLEVPPKGWGAIEKIVWEFHTNFQKLGIESEIKFATEIKPDEYDIVLCHVANLTEILINNNIPYVYQLHDHHVYHHGKDSYSYKKNKEAIDNSILSLVPAKYLVNYFESNKDNFKTFKDMPWSEVCKDNALLFHIERHMNSNSKKK